jgi:hypothetical protein
MSDLRKFPHIFSEMDDARPNIHYKKIPPLVGGGINFFLWSQLRVGGFQDF